ncbi:MAG: hypothetical protein U5L00_03740 [Desulfovermiculus sp.]|nr:hypothetical protein [Desulfovermiculus sp.]
MKLIITIDTEENIWNRYSATDNPVDNVDAIIPVQRLFDQYGFRPTYLVTYPVATNPRSVEILSRILEEGKCEIGMHCHRWNTPPFEGQNSIRKQDTMLSNLPADLIFNKLSAHHQAIYQNFGTTPISFRAGRWGFGPAVANSLCKLGYLVDSLVTPFVSWEAKHGPDFTKFRPNIFRFNSRGLDDRDAKGAILEVPVTIGFLQLNFQLSQRILGTLEKSILSKLHVGGILAWLGVLNRVLLSPEMTTAPSVIRLSRQMEKKGFSFLNLTFHSPSLQDGLSPFVRTSEEEVEFFKRLKMYLDFVRNQGWESMTLAEFESEYLNLTR